MEIERKFIGKMTDQFTTVFGNIPLMGIKQFYTKITPDEEIRYRMLPKVAIKTIKKGKGMVREEIETDVTLGEYNEAKKHIVGNYIEKERLRVVFGCYLFEIDVYSRPRSKDWATIELEFLVECDADKFKFPKAFAEQAFSEIREVTNDERFKNKNIALNGFPKIE